MQRNIEIRVITGPLPDSIHAAVTTEGGADRYTIVINQNATQDEKAAGFLHECLHIWHNDFKEGQEITKLEKQRAAELKRLFAGRDQEEQRVRRFLRRLKAFCWTGSGRTGGRDKWNYTPWNNGERIRHLKRNPGRR